MRAEIRQLTVETLWASIGALGFILFIIGYFVLGPEPVCSDSDMVQTESNVVVSGTTQDETLTKEITMYKLGEILESDDNYVVISDDDKVAIISKDMATFEISDTEIVILDEDGAATFYVTKERMVELVKI